MASLLKLLGPKFLLVFLPFFLISQEFISQQSFIELPVFFILHLKVGVEQVCFKAMILHFLV